MPELKLAKLPDRTPVKITITVPPDLNQALQEYAGLYRAQFGQSEPVAELIPFMLENFLAGDRGFAKSRKDPTIDIVALRPDEQPRRGRRSRIQTPPDIIGGA